MNRFLVVLLVLVVCVVGFGFYSGWWSLSSSSPDESNQVDVNLNVDPGKMKADVESVKDKTTELTGETDEDANGSGDQATDKVTPDHQ